MPGSDTSFTSGAASTDFIAHLHRLQMHFRGQMRVQLKPLAAAVGVGENTVRNAGNVLRIGGVDVRPTVINNRLTFDLMEVAAALAAADAMPGVPKARPSAPVKRGRPPKAGLEIGRQGGKA
jgi:hypothetical protein